MRRAIAALAMLASLAPAPAAAGDQLERVLGAVLGLDQGGQARGQRVSAEAVRYGYADERSYQQDRGFARAAQQRVLGGYVGEVARWENRATGNYGAIQVVAEVPDWTGRVCRRLRQEVVLNGYHDIRQDVACRPARGGYWTFNN